jgi:hypothetical protein
MRITRFFSMAYTTMISRGTQASWLVEGFDLNSDSASHRVRAGRATANMDAAVCDPVGHLDIRGSSRSNAGLMLRARRTPVVHSPASVKCGPKAPPGGRDEV